MSTSPFESELTALIRSYQDALKQRQHKKGKDDVVEGVQKATQLQTQCLAAIERATGRTSVYFQRATAAQEKSVHSWYMLGAMIGVAESLLHDMQNGYLKSLEQLVHGELFADFLEMAQHLLDSGFKDAAAVIAGSTLESHLRQLCAKAQIQAQDASGKPKKADLLNSELAAATVYSKLDQKNATAWLGLRNAAAHGDYDSYSKDQVALLVSSIRDFITRLPA